MADLKIPELNQDFEIKSVTVVNLTISNHGMKRSSQASLSNCLFTFVIVYAIPSLNIGRFCTIKYPGTIFSQSILIDYTAVKELRRKCVCPKATLT